jgi:exodeoxyribonuclease VII small subunit
MTDKPVSEMTFEEAMAELEAVVASLEHGEVPLDESIRLYERGAKLKAHCDARLKAAEEKVEQIRLGENGAPEGTKPFSAG